MPCSAEAAEAASSHADFDGPDQEVFGWDGLAVRLEALEVNGYRFPGVGERLRLRVSLRVATLESRDERMEAPVLFALEDDGISVVGDGVHARRFYPG